MAGWRRLGEGLSRRTGLTLAVAGAVTVLLGIGLGRLDFATGQDSYIDPASQVAHDNEQYQSLFGGENMVVLFTMPDDRTVVDLFSAGQPRRLRRDRGRAGGRARQIESVISPTSLLTWTQDMITSGVATDILGRTTAREPDAAAVALRQQDMTVTALRFAAAGEQDFANPDWLRFLIFGNDGFQVDADGQLVAPPDETARRAPAAAGVHPRRPPRDPRRRARRQRRPRRAGGRIGGCRGGASPGGRSRTRP